MNTYLILDIGTGNVRVALAREDGRLICVERDSVIYKKDDNYKEALFFEPDFLWNQILKLISKCLAENKDTNIIAITASSQREGIVLLDKQGASLIGFPNHDHRGRFMEDNIKDKNAVYKLTGRYPTSLFSALKLVAYREKYPKEWNTVDTFMSISDWAQYMLSGVKGYEHSQASETLLYDVERKCWSDLLLDVFNLDKTILPPLHFSGARLGNLKEEYARQFGLKTDIPVFVGGADTQLAIKSTRPQLGDIVLISGTTTPVVEVSSGYILDKKQRSWTNSHLDKKQYILETNCGVTGLNFQQVKAIFYPNDPYSLIEEEIDQLDTPDCFAHLGSLIANNKEAITRGGFLFDVPMMTNLSRADFAFATLWDIACSIKENLDCLLDIHPSKKDYVWCCGGGFQSRHLREYVAGLTGKTLFFRSGYQQASVSGAAVVCSDSFENKEQLDDAIEKVIPVSSAQYKLWYEKWKETRNKLKQ